MSEKRYAKIGDLVIHKTSGEMGRVGEVHPPNSYAVGERPVSCPVVVLKSGTPFLDVPGTTPFVFLPDQAERFRETVSKLVDATFRSIMSEAAAIDIDESDALRIAGSVIRERLRRMK